MATARLVYPEVMKPAPTGVVLELTYDEALVVRAVFGRLSKVAAFDLCGEIYPKAVKAIKAIGNDVLYDIYAVLDAQLGSDR